MANKDITFSILCPTRKRPDSMERLTKSIFNMAENPKKVEIIFYIDSDDLESKEKADELKQEYEIEYIIGERIVLSDMWNKCYNRARGSICFQGGDDIIMRTQGWDTQIAAKFDEIDDKIGFVFGDDMSRGHPLGHFGTHGFLHRNWIDTAGYFSPSCFSCDWGDTWLNDIAKMINRHYFVPIITEHMHPNLQKAEWDQVHLDRLERGKKDNVEQKYRDLYKERVEVADKLLKFIKEFKK